VLPTMQPVVKSRTRRARAMKAFEEVRIGPVRLFFCLFELIGFKLDGDPAVVCVPSSPVVEFVDPNRLVLEANQTKWVSRNEFEQKWEEMYWSVFQVRLGGR
jgi:hypothetical protein